MKRLRKFLSLTPRDRRLLLSAAFLLGAIRLGLSLLSFQTLRRLLAHVTQTPTRLRNADQSFPDRIAWAVAVASRYVPKATCLTQALATQVLCARQGHTACLCIGVAKGERGHLEAHAWVESQGRIVIGGSAVEHYTLLSAFEAERP